MKQNFINVHVQHLKETFLYRVIEVIKAVTVKSRICVVTRRFGRTYHYHLNGRIVNQARIRQM
jgi:hypothetical protein